MYIYIIYFVDRNIKGILMFYVCKTEGGFDNATCIVTLIHHTDTRLSMS